MVERAPVFDKIIADYLLHVAALGDRDRRRKALEITGIDDGFEIPFFNQSIAITGDGIVDEKGMPPSHSTSVLVCKYILLCPDHPADDASLFTYKDFRDAAPYVGGFRNTAEHPIARCFSGKVNELQTTGRALGGRPFDTDVACQLALQFQALPRVPIFLIFHDADEEFPAQCTLLFRKDAASYLDMECLAMIGGTLAHRLQGG